MKRVFGICATVLLLLATTACVQILRNSGEETAARGPADSLRFATLNVHYIILGRETGAWSVGDWERRKAPLDAAFKDVAADVFAFQEMESFARGSDGDTNLARDWLLDQNPAYRAAAVGDWRAFPSTQPIFFRADRLAVVDQGWFFFSDTPDVIYSRTFNGSWPAFASWAQFETRDGQRFRVINVHFEYKSRSNRILSAELVVDRMAPWIEAGENIVLIGDINARHGARTQDILAAAGLQFAPVAGATYHFNRGLNLFGAIDHIGVTQNMNIVGHPVVLRNKYLNEWPSDHYPVYADFRFAE
ncbi:Metal-dependent hydrolase, endonuclease/exonuclease/phosphatase family [Yoonia tamlensis]|uniref:Metal-dependent hydrolase, endonuclease/exonuclease/phosphatase family n=1 Tax=Yoonia tamlensis TaxID=390270 RepID=A0A1I6G389_9RHOB|nr:endonuclease [Yoonia tamlensis]SFR36580.1 Metal-dependent hydrolase, endonuclease/exonuclease/phosphatase family [Yoonia tamlensis]